MTTGRPATMSRTVTDLLPSLCLRITAGPLELRGLSDDDLPGLCELAEAGIHDPDRMPFSYPWTDAPAADLARNTAQYHWRIRAAFRPEAWEVALGVWFQGELVGAQGFSTQHYLVTRTGETGSWLGRAHQGHGIGTAMRQAMCAFVFDHLDGQEITSGAFTDNPASLAVSRKVGYRLNGLQRMHRRDGEVAVNQQLVLTPSELIRVEHDLIVEGAAPFRRSIGLDSPS